MSVKSDLYFKIIASPKFKFLRKKCLEFPLMGDYFGLIERVSTKKEDPHSFTLRRTS